jgi:hypothetical protein
MGYDTFVDIMANHNICNWGCLFDGDTLLGPEGEQYSSAEVLKCIEQMQSECKKLTEFIEWAKTCPKVG